MGKKIIIFEPDKPVSKSSYLEKVFKKWKSACYLTAKAKLILKFGLMLYGCITKLGP